MTFCTFSIKGEGGSQKKSENMGGWRKAMTSSLSRQSDMGGTVVWVIAVELYQAVARNSVKRFYRVIQVYRALLESRHSTMRNSRVTGEH